MRELIGLSYSPWTEKARWALDHHGLPYTYHEHVMIFEVPILRWKLRRFLGDVTVPAMVDRVGGKTCRLADSWDIAQHADRLGSSKRLFHENQTDVIFRYNELSEQALSAGRALLAGRMRDDPQALVEALPPFVPRLLRPRLLWVARFALSYIEREFATRAKDRAGHAAEFRKILLTLRKALGKAKGDHLLGDFSYADIAMAVTLQFVEPVSNKYKRIGPATRRAWTDSTLARDFRDLLDWRDRVYRKHRNHVRG